MRLIDADTLAQKKLTGTIGNISGDFVAGFDIDTSPTISAVPVVRCKECIYYKICDEWETGKRMLCEIHHHSYLGHDGDEHFCSWGQRKEAEHDKHPSDPV